MPAPRRKILFINTACNAPPYGIVRTPYIAKPHPDSLKNSLAAQIYKNGSLCSLFTQNDVITESYISVWKIIKTRKIASYLKFANFNLQSDVLCIRLFDPG